MDDKKAELGNKKAGSVISLQKYREKKRRPQAKKKAASNDIIYMETYKKKHKQPYPIKEDSQSYDKKVYGFTVSFPAIKEKNKNKDKDNLVNLDDYRRKKNRKWKKEFLFHTTQTAAMTFLFVFLFIGISSLNKPTSKFAGGGWFQAPKNKGLVIADKINNDRRKPASNSSCGIPSDKKTEKSINEMKKINPKDCQILRF